VLIRTVREVEDDSSYLSASANNRSSHLTLSATHVPELVVQLSHSSVTTTTKLTLVAALIRSHPACRYSWKEEVTYTPSD
jgi:hypothetical protein